MPFSGPSPVEPESITAEMTETKEIKISWVIDSLPCATSTNMFLVTHKYTNSYNTECATSTNKFLVTQKYTNTYNAEHSCARKSFRDNGLVLHRKQHLSFLEHRYYCPSILLTLKIIHS